MRRLVLFLLCSSPACADDRTIEVRAADELIHCMAVFNWTRMNTEGEKQTDVREWRDWFYVMAKDLTNDGYVVGQFKVEGMEFQERTERELFTLREWLPIELMRCYKMEFGPAITTRLKLLVETKSKDKVHTK